MAAVNPQVLDSSALRSIQMPDIVGGVEKAYTLKSMMDVNQLNNLKMNAENRQMQDQETARNILKDSDLSTVDGAYKAAQKLTKAGMPKQGMDIVNTVQSVQSGRYDLEDKQLKIHSDTQTLLDHTVGSVLASIQPMAEAKKPDGSPMYERSIIDQNTETALGNAISNLKNDKSLPEDVKNLALEQVRKYVASGQPITYEAIQKVYGTTKEGVAAIKAHMEQRQGIADLTKTEADIKLKGAETRVADARARTLATAGSKAFTEDEGDLMAALADAGVNLPAGFKGKDQQKALYAGLLRKHPEMTVDEIAAGIKAGTIRMVAEKSEARAVGTRQASVDIPLAALTDKGGIFDQLDTAADKINLGDSKTASQLRLAWAGKAVANPDILVYKNLVQDARSEMAQALQKGGAPTEGSAARAKEMFPDTMSLGEYRAAKGAAIAVAGAVKRGSARVLDAISNSKPLGEIISSAKRDTSDDGRAPPAGGPKEGDTATGPNGAKIKFSNGAWVKM